MNQMRFTVVLFIILCFFPPLLTARDASNIVGDTFEEIAGRGLEIRTNPPGVRIFINGIEHGFSPAIFDNLPSGEHLIRLNREGYKDRIFNVILFNASRLVVSIKMEEERGLVNVSVYRADGSPENLPLNPQVFTNMQGETSNNVPLSHDNKALLNLPTGYRTIRARAFGWEETSVTVLVDEQNAVAADIFMRPAPLRLRNASQSRRRFNPMNQNNLGVTEFRFEVSAPGSGKVTILVMDDNSDDNSMEDTGSVVWEKQLDNFDSWFQFITWNGRDSNGNPVPQGIYKVLIEAWLLHEFSLETTETFSLQLQTEIDYSINIFPLSINSGVSGLTFAPLPHVLPAGSYQLEAGLLYGSFHLPSANIINLEQKTGEYQGLPFQISMRISPVKRLELTTVFNVNLFIENQSRNAANMGAAGTDAAGTGAAEWGISGSAKYNILNGNNSIPLALAAALSYTWSGNTGEYPLTPGRGIGFYAPLSLELTNTNIGAFSVVVCPALFWRGPEGFVPEVLLSAGILFRTGWLNAGLSMRYEFDFSDNASPRFLAGAEVNLFPPPSNLVFSLRAGLMNREQHTGGYGGLSIGVIY
jgi:hypothetical protein